MAEAEVKRLSKVAKELNVGLANIVEFLHEKGHPIDRNPNTKIDPELYLMVLGQFASDKVVKEESQKILAKAAAPEEVIEKKKEPTKIEEQEHEEILIKDSKIIEVAPIKPVEEVVPAKSDDKPSVTVLGKIDLASMNFKTKPDKKSKTKEVTPAVKPTEEIAETKKAKGKKKAEKEEVVKEDIAKEEISIPTPIETPKVEEVKIVEEVDNHHHLKFTKLEGPTILGRMELPVKEEKKKQSHASSAADDKEKKKRKRIKKGAITPDAAQNFPRPAVNPQQRPPSQGGFQRPGGGGGFNRPSGGGNFQRGKFSGPRPAPSAVPKAGLTDEEIQKQIKETLARLSGGGKSKSSKMRKERREENRAEQVEKDARKAEESKVLKVTEFVSASELAKMMDESVTKIISTCMSLGMFVSINQRLSAEVITIVAEEFGYTVEFVSAEESVQAEDDNDDPSTLEWRPPIVTVMGHVDHGKTSLLDYIRKSNVIAGEAGGITQHIGSYLVKVGEKSICFLDTPGHEAFTAMRARGAQVTDIVIIVIAADDSVMPQTKEAINHAQAAGVPIVFAFNKIDKPDANADKIREQLANMNILVEEWGGKFQTQEVSAKKGLNVETLLEKVLLETEILDLKANPNKNAVGTIIESSLDKGRGYISNILVQSGTLNVGDVVLAGSHFGKVKAMFNERGQSIKTAGPSTPVLMLGLTGAPQAGDKFKVMEDEREAKDIASKRSQLMREQGIRTHKHITLDEIGRRLAIGDFKELNIIVKGDVDGSVEALTDSLLKLSTNNIQVNVIHKSVGQVTESDVLLASASNAIIVAFQVRPSASARKLAEQEEIDIRHYSIIYDAINEVKAAMEGMLAPEFEEKIVCNIEIREVFKISKVGTIAGCMVLDGKVNRNTKVRVIRDGIVIHSGSLGSLKRFKDDVKEVATGFECGLNIDGFNDIQTGDIIEGYENIEIKKKL